MILTKEHEQFMEQTFPYIKVNKNKITVSVATENPSFTVPSELFPIKNKKRMQLYSAFNTKDIFEDEDLEIEEKEKLIKAFNNTNFEVGRCYTNTKKLKEEMDNAGIKYKDAKPYVGWILVWDTLVHHAWLIYKNEYLIDGGMSKSELKILQQIEEYGITEKEEMRKFYAEKLNEEENKKNAEVKTFGSVVPTYLYIGCPQEPMNGAGTFSDLMKTFPNHPSYAHEGMNSDGASIVQEKRLKTKSKKMPGE